MSDTSDCKTIDSAELLGLFRHWDTVVGHKELLYTPLSFAAIGAVASAWDKVTPWLLLAVAAGSILIYVFYLMSIRRVAIFQDRIFRILADRSPEFSGLVAPSTRFGVRVLRIIMLPGLAAVWCLVILSKLHEGKTPTIEPLWVILLVALFAIPTLIALGLHREHRSTAR